MSRNAEINSAISLKKVANWQLRGSYKTSVRCTDFTALGNFEELTYQKNVMKPNNNAISIGREYNIITIIGSRDI